MDVYASLLNGAMLAVFTAILAWLGKTRFDGLERRMDRIESRLDQMAAEIAQLRSDLLQVALSQQPRPQTG